MAARLGDPVGHGSAERGAADRVAVAADGVGSGAERVQDAAPPVVCREQAWVHAPGHQVVAGDRRGSVTADGGRIERRDDLAVRRGVVRGLRKGAAHDDGAATVTALDVALGSQALVGVRDRGARHLQLGGQHT